MSCFVVCSSDGRLVYKSDSRVLSYRGEYNLAGASCNLREVFVPVCAMGPGGDLLGEGEEGGGLAAEGGGGSVSAVALELTSQASLGGHSGFMRHKMLL